MRALGDAIAFRLRNPIDLAFLAGRPAKDGKPAEPGWREALMVIGAACLLRGIAMWSHPAAWVVAGIGSIAVAYWLSEAATPRSK